MYISLSSLFSYACISLCAARFEGYPLCFEALAQYVRKLSKYWQYIRDQGPALSHSGAFSTVEEVDLLAILPMEKIC